MRQAGGVDATYDDSTRDRLIGLFIGLHDRLSPQEASWGREYLANDALGLTLEMMADWLSVACAPLSDDERHQMMVLAARLNMSGRVRRALASCPRVGGIHLVSGQMPTVEVVSAYGRPDEHVTVVIGSER